MTTFTITPSTTYSLRESAEFGFGGRTSGAFDGVMRLAFCLDGYTDQVGVELRQQNDGTSRARCTASAPIGRTT